MPQAKPTSKHRRLSKEGIIAAIQEAARQMGRVPRSREFGPLSGISVWQVTGRFGTYCNAVRAAGLKPSQQGVKTATAALLEDWGKVVRQIGAVPSRSQYREAGSYSPDCFSARFERWTNVPAEFARFFAAGGLVGDWTDVVEKIRKGPIPQKGASAMLAWYKAARAAYEGRARESAVAEKDLPGESSTLLPVAAGMTCESVAGLEAREQEEVSADGFQPLPPLMGKKCVTATMLAVFVAELAPSALPWIVSPEIVSPGISAACFPRRALHDRPLLGAPTRMPGLGYEPVNEMGVLVLFSMICRQLGFVIESVQAGFPDCEAKLEVEPGRWQHFRIECEYESRNFKDHRHDPEKCDLIVCWRHNWKDCPPHLQVLELSKMMQLMQNF